MDRHPRKLLAEAGDPAGKQIGSSAFHEADVQISGEALRGLHLLPGLFRELQDLARPAIKKPSCLGDRQTPLSADKERDPQFLLQALDLIGQRRLTHLQALSCACDIQFLRHNDEIVQSA